MRNNSVHENHITYKFLYVKCRKHEYLDVWGIESNVAQAIPTGVKSRRSLLSLCSPPVPLLLVTGTNSATKVCPRCENEARGNQIVLMSSKMPLPS